jgi:hypothetical protein
MYRHNGSLSLEDALPICTTIEQRGVVRILWAKNMDAAKDIHKEILPIWAYVVIANARYDGDWLLAGRVGIDSRQGYFSP